MPRARYRIDTGAQSTAGPRLADTEAMKGLNHGMAMAAALRMISDDGDWREIIANVWPRLPAMWKCAGCTDAAGIGWPRDLAHRQPGR